MKHTEFDYDFFAHLRDVIESVPEQVAFKNITRTEEETISYYEVARYLYTHGLYKALSTDEFRLYMDMGRSLAKHPK